MEMLSDRGSRQTVPGYPLTPTAPITPSAVIAGRQEGTDDSKESNSSGKVPLDLRKPPKI